MACSRLRLDRSGRLWINGKGINGVVSSIMVDGSVIWKEQTLLLQSGNEKTFNGFSDSEITINLRIYELMEGKVSRYDSLAIINDAFKSVEDKKSVPYQLEGDIFRAMQLKEAFFSTMNVNEIDDSLLVTIVLRENRPSVSKVQDQQQPKPEPEKAAIEPVAMSDGEKAALTRLEGVYN